MFSYIWPETHTHIYIYIHMHVHITLYPEPYSKYFCIHMYIGREGVAKVMVPAKVNASPSSTVEELRRQAQAWGELQNGRVEDSGFTV